MCWCRSEYEGHTFSNKTLVLCLIQVQELEFILKSGTGIWIYTWLSDWTCTHIHTHIYIYIHIYIMLVSQSCLTLCDPLVCSLPGSSLHGILQTRILQWVAIPFSRGSSQPSRSLLVIHFIYGSVYMSIPNSLPRPYIGNINHFVCVWRGNFGLDYVIFSFFQSFMPARMRQSYLWPLKLSIVKYTTCFLGLFWDEKTDWGVIKGRLEATSRRWKLMGME